jgi:hypothetical protein
MSDMSQGPGWWIASDGKWYPPHLHPSVQAPEPTTPSSDGALTDHEPDAGGPAGTARDPQTPGGFMGAPASPGAEFAPPGTFGSAPTAGAANKRTRNTVVAAVAVAVVLVVVVGAVVALGGDKSASAEVIDAVHSTLNDKTADVTMNLSVQADGQNITETGTGGIDFSDNALDVHMVVNTQGQQIPITVDYLGGVAYENIPGLDGITPGKSWVSVDLSALESTDSTSGFSLGGNPAATLQMLAQQGNAVVALGPSTVGGVPVNGYAVTIDPGSIAEKLKQADLPAWMQQAASTLTVHAFEVKVFVDDSGLLRSTHVQMTESTAKAGTIVIDETLDYSAYGTPVSVTAPPAGQVESLQQFLQAEASQSGSSS